MAAARRVTNKKVTRPAFSAGSSPNSAPLGQHRSHPEDDTDTSKRVSSAQSRAPPKPPSPLSTGHHQRSRVPRKEDDEISINEMWEQSPGPYIATPRSSKRPPDCKQYLAYTTSAANKISRCPGPGSYNAGMKPSGPSFSMGSRASLTSMETSQSPGPGAYDVTRKNSGPSFSMGPKVRMPVSQRDLNPGPGTYSDLTSAFGSGSAFSIGERHSGSSLSIGDRHQ